MSNPRTDVNFLEFVRRITYKNWSFRVEIRGERDVGDVFIQPIFLAPDNTSGGIPILQKCRKWFVSRYSCDTEIVQSCWAAVQRAELHEMQEQFLFDGKDVFNNHIDVHALKTIADQVDQREPE